MGLIEFSPTCRGCTAEVGHRHNPGCDNALCAEHGRQLIGCLPGCEPIVWTGYRPGELEAVEFGWFAYFATDGTGWQRCGPDNPHAQPDLNRIMVECDWDRSTQRYIKNLGHI